MEVVVRTNRTQRSCPLPSKVGLRRQLRLHLHCPAHALPRNRTLRNSIVLASVSFSIRFDALRFLSRGLSGGPSMCPCVFNTVHVPYSAFVHSFVLALFCSSAAMGNSGHRERRVAQENKIAIRVVWYYQRIWYPYQTIEQMEASKVWRSWPKYSTVLCNCNGKVVLSWWHWCHNIVRIQWECSRFCKTQKLRNSASCWENDTYNITVSAQNDRAYISRTRKNTYLGSLVSAKVIEYKLEVFQESNHKLVPSYKNMN